MIIYILLLFFAFRESGGNRDENILNNEYEYP